MRKLLTLMAPVVAAALVQSSWAQDSQQAAVKAQDSQQAAVKAQDSQQAAVKAQDSQQAAVKIGFVNTLEVLYGTEEGKQEVVKVQQYMDEKQRDLETKTAELEKLKEQFATQQRTLNPETRLEMQRTIEERDRQLKRFQEDTQIEITRRRDELLSNMSMKIQRVIQDHAEKNQFGAVFIRDDSQPYVAPWLDITADIIRIYNQNNPVSASPSPAPSTPKPPG